MKPSIEELILAISKSWGGDTCFEESDWSTENPARGQCVVSSLVFQKIYGGELLRYKVHGDGVDESHFCNILDNGTIIDTTASQYNNMDVSFRVSPSELDTFKTARDKKLADPSTFRRYKLLLQRVQSHLLENSTN